MLELSSLLLAHKQNPCFSSSHTFLPLLSPKTFKLFTPNSFPLCFSSPSLMARANISAATVPSALGVLTLQSLKPYYFPQFLDPKRALSPLYFSPSSNLSWLFLLTTLCEKDPFFHCAESTSLCRVNKRVTVFQMCSSKRAAGERGGKVRLLISCSHHLKYALS